MTDDADSTEIPDGGAPSMSALACHGTELHQLAALHGLSNLRVFGSVAAGTADDRSDYDLIADAASLFDVEAFRQAAEDLLGAPVGLVTSGALSAGFDPVAVPVPGRSTSPG